MDGSTPGNSRLGIYLEQKAILIRRDYIHACRYTFKTDCFLTLGHQNQ